MNKSQFLPLSILGVMLLLFGVIDIVFVNPAIGIVLAVLGAFLAVFGWNRHKKLKQ